MNKNILLPVMFLLGSHVPDKPPVKKIPVIIIMSDQLRYDALGKFTPNINSLKEEGITFNNAYCACPLCAPSRGSFFTGLYPDNSGSLINGWAKEDEHYRDVKAGTPNLYQAMEGIWDSRHIGKQHFFTADRIDQDPGSRTRWITKKDYHKWLKKQNIPAPGGREYSDKAPELISEDFTRLKSYSIPETGIYKPGIEYYFDHYIAGKAVDAIHEKRENDKPLLINAMFLAPHPPLSVPEPYFSRIKQDELDIPENVGVWYDGQSPLQMYNLTGFFGSRYSRKEWSAIWPKYMGLVSLLDDEVGRILQALKNEGLYDKALIIFTADHGEMLGSHSLWQKMCMYEESVRVPLIIKFPSDFSPAIHRSDELVSLIDIWPTLKDYLGLEVPGTTDGISLMPLVKGQEAPRKRIFIQYDGNAAYGNNQRCVVEGKRKLIVDTFKDEVYLELYDVGSDPREKVNLALDPGNGDMVKDLLGTVRTFMRENNDRLVLPASVYETFMKNYTPAEDEGGDE